MTTPVSKRSVLKLAGWASLAATAALVGCGKKDAAADAASAASDAAPVASAAPEGGTVAAALAEATAGRSAATGRSPGTPIPTPAVTASMPIRLARSAIWPGRWWPY